MRKSTLVLLALLINYWGVEPMQAQQICEGNLGENIFEDGDFGSGIPNIMTMDPDIAPGYVYTLSGPPVDGFYNLTNSTAVWSGLFGTWMALSDNSPDPNGYMMVVNASFEPGLFYEQLVEGLCENTLYEFSADIINLIRFGVTDHIEPNVSFLLDGQQVYTTGNIGQTETWNTYGFTFSTGPGQTSITLALRNNAPGGIGNDLALDNISFRACGPEALILPEDVANICEDGDPLVIEATIIGEQYDTPNFQWQYSPDGGVTWIDLVGENGPTYTHTQLSSGMYYYRYLLANEADNLSSSKCRVISNVKVINVVPKFFEIIDTICTGLSYLQAGNSYDQTGIYVDSLISSLGCDSIVTLDLTVVPDTEIGALLSVSDPICFGEAEGSVSLDSVWGGAPPLQYSLSGAAPGNQFNFLMLGGGEYSYEIVDRFGCSFSTTFLIDDPPEFVVDLGPDITVDLGELVELSPVANQAVDTFYWSPSDLFSCELVDCWNPIWAPANTVAVNLQAFNEQGCIAEDDINIEVIKVRKVYIPNIFTPNFDGNNDYFTIFGAIPNVVAIVELNIFDRWGEVVYGAREIPPNEVTLGWDGTLRGKEMDEGVYVYLAKVRFLDQEVVLFSGDLLLMR